MYMVTVKNKGVQFWLGGTVWRFAAGRADIYSSKEEAQRYLDKAKQFMVPAIYKASTIVEAKPEDF